MTISMVFVESDLYLISCLHPKYHCKLKQSRQLCKTGRCIYSTLPKSIWGSSITQMLRQKNRVNDSKIKVSQRPKPLKFLNLMPLVFRFPFESVRFFSLAEFRYFNGFGNIASTSSCAASRRASSLTGSAMTNPMSPLCLVPSRLPPFLSA